jgi:hypothetical protein
VTTNFHHMTNLNVTKQICFIVTLLNFLFVVGCGQNTGSPETSSEREPKDESYEDGTYCADVTYYNPYTQKQNEYTLNVDVEDGKLTKVYWSNGGWLDDSHFTPPEVSQSGDCSFTSDKGYQYTVSINGSECLSTDNPDAIEGREGNITRKQCADLYGASSSLFNDFLKERKVSADDVIDDEDCDLMHKSLETLERLRNLEERMNKGYIQQVYTKTSGYGAVCQTFIVKRYGILYLLEVGQGEATMGLTSFNPKEESWQELMIQEKPDEELRTVVVARVITSGSMSYLEDLSKGICQ